MFKRFAGDSTGRRREPLSSRDLSKNLPIAAILLASPIVFGSSLAAADVGLPSYESPVQESNDPQHAAGQFVVKQISHGADADATPLTCGEATDQNGSALDFAPPADQRVEQWETLASEDSEDAHARIPVYINGNLAALRTGKAVSAIDAITIQGRTLLLSYDKDYFNRLQAIRPRDKLLVQTQQSLRQYQVTRAEITQAGLEAETPASEDTLTLAACYPFQPVGNAPLLYVVNARPFPAALPHHSATEEGGSYETVNF